MNEFEFEGKSFGTPQSQTRSTSCRCPRMLSADILELAGTSLNPWGTVPVDATIAVSPGTRRCFREISGRYYDLPLKLKMMPKLGLVDDQSVVGAHRHPDDRGDASGEVIEYVPIWPLDGASWSEARWHR